MEVAENRSQAVASAAQLAEMELAISAKISHLSDRRHSTADCTEHASTQM